ncbi:isopeptide-forming domain-containing fimbrial protein [Anaerococcus vaginalis]|uniref:isopeptide-forming domain-containing fimbrial protein n=1 Tax=Anaerococcus vaginalis TaxID=33037 RepID=UPI00290EDEC6|nr:isopeptide-forming domain-containing fimbrial protein [Anaerococcus vaginalis]MDU5823674.1 isopeptide-forming domain-containing fimbrial protein [Anaerococcus vaginalis]
MKHKILSFLTAFAMVFGIVAAPFVNANAAPQAGTPVGPTADTETTAKVTIHKIKVKSTEGFPIEQLEGATEIVGKDNTTKYDGGKIDDKNITGFFGEGAEELEKVTFTYWVFDDKDTYEKMVKAPTDYDTVEKVQKEAKVGEGKDVVTTKTGVAIPDIKVPANGHKYIWAVEKSKTITGTDGKQQTITGAKAVPFGLALPLFKADGSVNTDIHVYPKNTTANEPKVDKDFEGLANAEQDRNEIDKEIKKDVKVGDVQPYDIETIIPTGAKYQTVAWTDQMTEGLTFDNNVKIMIGAKGQETEWNKANYEVKQDGNGFILELTKAGLAELEEKAKTADVRLLVKYSATVNENAKVERQERNDVIFHYGNDPHHGNTPYPTKPSKGSLTVNKEFTGAEGDWKDGEKVTVTLIDAHTGKPATNLPDGQTAVVELTKGTKESHTWTGLDNDKQYIVKEKFTAGDEVTYVKQDDGSIKIQDKKTDNPTPKDPQEPGLVTYGHRFQKVDHEGKGLPDAEFVVKDGNGADAKYLKEKDNKTKKFEQAAYAAAEKAYKDAVKEGKADTEIAKLKETRDAAYVAVNTQWEFTGTSKDDAYVFKSDVDGYFKVTGLKKGTYYLEEKEAPKGYAKLTSDVDFTVSENSTGATTLETGKLKDDNGFKQIENKKVTIPQTGGIGSIIFVVAGLMIMGLAAYKMKANKEQA